MTAARSAAAVIYYARRFAAEAKMLEGQAPELAELLRDTASTIAQGKEVTEKFHKSKVNAKEIATMNERVEAARAEAQEKFRQMDEGLEKLDDDATRTRFMRQVAALKADAAPYMDQPEMTDYQRPAEQGRYEGMAARTPRESEIKEEADKQVREIAEKYGVNPSATVERYSGGAPSKALADQYGDAEARERERHRSVHGDREETAAQRDQELARMHREIAVVYAAANATARDTDSTDQRTEAVRNMAAADAAQTAGANASKETAQDEQQRLDQERRNAERKARERDGGRGL